MLLRAVVLALLGSVSVAVIYVMSGPDAPPPASSTPSQSLAESQAAPQPAGRVAASPLELGDLRPAVGAAAPVELADRHVRDVTPSDMTAGPLVTGSLVRIAPPPKPAPPAEPEAEPLRSERLPRPVISAAGLVVAGKREIRLAGIQAPGPEQTCGDSASAWPCGRMARAAMRRFVRGRALECEVPAGADAIPDPARCLVAGVDLSEWLVAQGWASANGPRYGAQESAARDSKRGLWATSRPGARPDRTAARAPARAISVDSRSSGTP